MPKTKPATDYRCRQCGAFMVRPDSIASGRCCNCRITTPITGLTPNEVALITALSNLVALIRNQDCTITRKGGEKCLGTYLDNATNLINSIINK